MIYDGFDFSGLLRCNPSRRVMTQVSVESAAVPGADGALAGRVALKPMSVEVTATVCRKVADHFAFSELRRMLASRLFRREPAWLVLDDDPAVRLKALLEDAPELDGWWQGARVTLRFWCPDPVAYGRRVRVELPEGTSRFQVSGTYQTRPAFTVSARAGAAAKVADAASGRHVQVPASASARTVAIDCAARRCTAGGQAVAPTLASRWISLEPGWAEVEVAGGTATMEYDERWL